MRTRKPTPQRPRTLTTITRRDPTERDVRIEILFRGICHSDLYMARKQGSCAR